MIVSIIAAMDKNRVIGREGGLPWKLPSDMRWFKEHTTGKPVVMGRKTFESLGKKPLANRFNVVVTSDPNYSTPAGVIVSATLDEAFECLEEEGIVTGEPDDEIMIIGGAQVYETALPAADQMYITEIDNEYEGDTYFPEFEEELWVKTELKSVVENGTKLHFNLYTRK